MVRDRYVHAKQRKSSLKDGALFFKINKQFLDTDHLVRKIVVEERKLQKAHPDGEKKGWNWDNYVTLHREQQKINERLAKYGYICMNNGS